MALLDKNIATQSKRSYLDVSSGGRGVSTKAEKKVCREVLHCD
jgi:hypothetical protein